MSRYTVPARNSGKSHKKGVFMVFIARPYCFHLLISIDLYRPSPNEFLLMKAVHGAGTFFSHLADGKIHCTFTITVS